MHFKIENKETRTFDQSVLLSVYVSVSLISEKQMIEREMVESTEVKERKSFSLHAFDENEDFERKFSEKFCSIL